jgi:response regulator RpfG family c-di-GMP phosphodiesterase
VKQKNKTNILILEQNQVIVNFFINDLTSVGYKVLTSSFAAQALDVIANNTIDMILFDVNMQGNSEDTFIQELKFSPALANIPVIVLGEATDADSITTALALGADEFVEKSYILSVMLNRIYNTLRLSVDRSFDQEEDENTIAAPVSYESTYEPAVIINDDSLDNTAMDKDRFPGINYQEGVRNVLGDDDLFIEILTMFYDDHAQDKALIEQAILANDFTRCKSLVHTLKGVAGSIGAVDLFNATKSLDTALTLKQEETYQSLFTPVKAALCKIVSGLESSIINKK